MRYDLSKLPLNSLLRPISDAASALARLDERIARSAVGSGLIERAHFSDACASLWIEGELVHLEDLVLHDAHLDVRAPTHELTIATDVLRSRRRIAGQPAAWALSPDGIRILRSHGDDMTAGTGARDGAEVASGKPAAIAPSGEGPDTSDPLAVEIAAMDAVLARSDAALTKASAPGPITSLEKDALVYDLDWDEDERLAEWRVAVDGTEGLPPVLRAALLLDAWNSLQVLQHASWLGRLLAAAALRQAGLTTTAHLVAINLGLKS
ncbi:RHE_PE00001 family protein, partial [Rhizobium sp. BR 318]